MSKIIASLYLSLDGVMEHPAWTMSFWNDEAAAIAHPQLFEADALLLGRVTYEGFAQAWPGMTDAEGFAARMNALPKYVASRTLAETTWNARLLPGPDAADAVAELKQQGHQTLLVYGSAELVRALLRRGLIDELRLWVHPVVVGQGKRLFAEAGDAATLELVGTQTTSTGVVVLAYRPAEPAG